MKRSTASTSYAQVQPLFFDLELIKEEIPEDEVKEEDITQNELFKQVFVKEEFNDELTFNAEKSDHVEEHESVELKNECTSPSLYNTDEDMEITIDEIKPEIKLEEESKSSTDICMESESFRQEFPTLELQVKAPARTYQRHKRTSATFKRPSSCVAGEDEGIQNKIKVIAVEEVLASPGSSDMESSPPDTHRVTGEEFTDLMVDSLVTTDKSVDVFSKIKAFIDTENGNQLRIYDKRHVCFYCKQRHLNMTGHLVIEHKDETEVSSVLNRYLNECTSVTKTQEFIYIRRVGDFQHNVQVLASGKGDLVLLKPSQLYKGKTTHHDFLPCVHCLGFVEKNYLWNHHRKCALKPKEEAEALPLPERNTVKRSLVKESHALLHYATVKKSDETFKTYVLSKLTSAFGKLARDDTLIVMFGRFLTEEMKTSSVNWATEIKLKMQKLGCVLLSCRKLGTDKSLQFNACLTTEFLDLLMYTIKTLFLSRIKQVDELEMYQSLLPDIALCVFLWRGKCLFERNLVAAEKVLEFYYSFSRKWSREIECQGQLVIYKKPTIGLQGRALPQPSEVIRLKKFLTQRVVKLTNDMKMSSVSETLQSLWYDLVESLVCLICLFNSVEFNVVQKITIADYAVHPDWSIDDLVEYEGRMTSVAYHLAAKRFIFPTEYLCKEFIILLTSDMKKAMDLLISKRKATFISPRNPFVFAKQNFDPESTFSVTNCFHDLCVKTGILDRDVMKISKKRQFLTYLTYIADMCDGEVEWTRQFLESPRSKPEMFVTHFSQAFHLYEINNVFENIKMRDECPKNIANQLKEQKTDIQPMDRNLKEEATSSPVIKKDDQVIKTPGPVVLNLGKGRTGKYWEELILQRFKEDVKNETVPGKKECLQFLIEQTVFRPGKNWKQVKNIVGNEIEKNKMIHNKTNPLFCDDY